MDRQPWSRRRLLATIGAGLVGAGAGCTVATPDATEESTPRTDEGTATPATSTDSTTSTDRTADPDAETGTRELDDETAEPTSRVTDIYRDVVDSVVAVRVDSAGGQAGGTAWVYDADHLVTNEHVVSDAESVSVWFDEGGWRPARVVGTDVYSDLAVLEVKSMSANATPLGLTEKEPPIGTEVVAVGNPFGLTGSISTGVVSGRNRALPAANGFSIPDAIQTDAPVNPGNSGGPLVDMDGTVVGVVNSGGGDNIGFAISAAMVRRVVPALIGTGNYDHPYMGVRIREVSPRLAEANDLDRSWGLYIHEVVDGAPADGVLRGSTGSTQVGDEQVPTGGDVIVRLGETDIRTSARLSTFLALETSPGDTVAVTVRRDGERETSLLQLGSRPDPA
jgi:S1-C subfamily serine protease